jgi:hypothetical protein
VLWASASRGATVRELRAPIGLTRERLEAAYAFLLEYPLPGLTLKRHAFLRYLGLHHLAELPPLPDLDTAAGFQA